MKTLKKIKTPFFFILLLMMFAAPALHAQTGFGDNVDDENPPQDPDPAPINNTIWIGFIGATAIAYVIMKDKKTVR